MSVVFATDFGEICTGNNSCNCKSVLFYLFLVPVSPPRRHVGMRNGRGCSSSSKAPPHWPGFRAIKQPAACIALPALTVAEKIGSTQRG